MTRSPEARASGPINNKMLCYGILSMAKDAIRDFNAQRAAGKIIAPPLALMGKDLTKGEGEKT